MRMKIVCYVRVVSSPEKTQHCPKQTGRLVFMYSRRISTEPFHWVGLFPRCSYPTSSRSGSQTHGHSCSPAVQREGEFGYLHSHLVPHLLTICLPQHTLPRPRSATPLYLFSLKHTQRDFEGSLDSAVLSIS